MLPVKISSNSSGLKLCVFMFSHSMFDVGRSMFIFISPSWTKTTQRLCHFGGCLTQHSIYDLL